MSPITGNGYKLIEGDCVEVMAGMDDNTLDLTVTSPPYDNLRDYGKGFDADSFDWRPIIKELYRVTAVGGVVVWVVADATINGSETGTSFKQALWAMECGFRLHDTMIYHRKGMPMSHNRYEQHFEYMFIFSKGKPKTFNPILKKNKFSGELNLNRRKENINGNSLMRDGRKPFVTKDKGTKGNIWEYNVGGKSVNHPASFPEALANDHIISWSNPGDLVFDPFLGSGTTGKMAIRNGRKFIGCDIESSYVDIARHRIETEIVRIANAAGDYVTTPAEKERGQIALWDMT